MRASTNITRKERNSLILNNLRGADFSSSPLDAASNRAVEMRNLYCDGGRLRKRHGWNEKYTFGARINGIFDYKDYKIVHAGKKLYKFSDGNCEEISSNIKLADEKSQAFLNNDRLYIIGAGNYFALEEKEEKDKKILVLTAVTDLEDVYIPTTTISINHFYPNGDKNDKQDVLDDVNRLTTKRKNQLVGTEKPEKTRWKLDSSVDGGKEVTVEIEWPQYYQKVILKNLDWVKNSSKEYTYATLKSEDVIELPGHDTNSAANEGVDLTVPIGKDFGKIEANGIFTIGETNVLYTGTLQNRDNITVTFSHEYEDFEKKKEQICGCTFGVVFGVEGRRDTLFLSGNPDYPNMVFWSDSGDFTYFPDINYAVLGSPDIKIMGFDILSDNTLSIYKEENASEPSIYYANGYYEKFTLSGIEVSKDMYSFKSGTSGEGSVSPYACTQLAGDNLMLSQNGVFGIVLTDNVSTNERYARERSRLINKRLCKHDLSEAAGIAYKNRYYLSVDDVCYVADARYKASVDNDIDGSYNYEWWYWDNVPARVWAVIDGQLCFGTKDGKICVFDDEYTDRTYTVSSSGDFTVNSVNHSITYNQSLSISNGDIVSFDRPIYALILKNAEVTKDGKIKASPEDIMQFHERCAVCVDNVGSSGLKVNTPYEVTNIDYGECTFSFKDTTLNRGGFNIYKKLENELYVTNVDEENGTFQLSELPNPDSDDILKISTYNNGGTNDPVAIKAHKRPVVAEWYSPMLDFGTCVSSKTLLGLTAVSEPVQGGKLSFGYETRNASRLYEMKGINTFSLDNLDFNNFSLDTGFATSYSVRTFEKFNFIQFRFVSDNDKDCAFNSLIALYKINKINRGVR